MTIINWHEFKREFECLIVGYEWEGDRGVIYEGAKFGDRVERQILYTAARLAGRFPREAVEIASLVGADKAYQAVVAAECARLAENERLGREAWEEERVAELTAKIEAAMSRKYPGALLDVFVIGPYASGRYQADVRVTHTESIRSQAWGADKVSAIEAVARHVGAVP